MLDEQHDILISTKQTENYLKEHGLKKVLQGVHLWAIGVGALLSGVSFGLNQGMKGVGSLDFLVAMVVVTLFYGVLVLVFSELATYLPYAGGPYAYARKGMGSFMGYMTGILTIIEFLCASAALTISIGLYFGQLIPSISPVVTTLLVYMIFFCVDMAGVRISLVFQLAFTVIALSALIIFMLGVGPAVSIGNLLHNFQYAGEKGGILSAIPFAVMIYICIESISLAAEETKNPDRAISFGFKSSMATVVVLSASIILLSVASVDIGSFKYRGYSLEEILLMAQPDDAVLITVFSTLTIGILFASLHSLIYGLSRQLFSLSRAGYFPKFLSKIHKSAKTPHWAIITAGIVAMLLSYNMSMSGLLSVMGTSAALMYIFILISYLKIDMAGSTVKRKILVWMALAFGIGIFILFVFQGYRELVPLFVGIVLSIIHYFVTGKDLIAEDAPEEIEAKVRKIKTSGMDKSGDQDENKF